MQILDGARDVVLSLVSPGSQISDDRQQLPGTIIPSYWQALLLVVCSRGLCLLRPNAASVFKFNTSFLKGTKHAVASASCCAACQRAEDRQNVFGWLTRNTTGRLLHFRTARLLVDQSAA